MTAGTIVMIAAVVVAAVIVAAVASRRRKADGVDSFRRQIDALSPEARRPVVDQVQNAADRQARDEPADDVDTGHDHGDDEDDLRGT